MPAERAEMLTLYLGRIPLSSLHYVQAAIAPATAGTPDAGTPRRRLRAQDQCRIGSAHRAVKAGFQDRAAGNYVRDWLRGRKKEFGFASSIAVGTVPP